MGKVPGPYGPGMTDRSRDHLSEICTRSLHEYGSVRTEPLWKKGKVRRTVWSYSCSDGTTS